MGGIGERIDGFWKYFCPDFGFKARYDLTDFRILQLRWVADSSTFRALILDFACSNNIFARILD